MRHTRQPILSHEVDALSNFLPGHKKGDPIPGPQAIAAVNSLMRIGLMQMHKGQEAFIRVRNRFGRTPKRRFVTAGNKWGKSNIGFGEDIAHSMGFRPWLKPDDPDYRIRIKVPNDGLIGCETMLESVPGIVEPALRKLIPLHCRPDWKNNQQGALKSVTIPFDYLGNRCGSTIHIRSYNQLAITFEGIDYNWEHWDEPPPKDVLEAAERGKITTNAPSWFTMTALLGAYLYNGFYLHAFNIGGTDEEIAAFDGSSWDNCQDYCRDCDVYIPENNPDNMTEEMFERPVNRCPNCGRIMGWVSKDGLEEYFKTITDPQIRKVREEGGWLHLSGLVYKELDRAIHIYKDFEIPKDWMKIEVVDPHDARSTRWLFGAVSPEDIVINGKTANRIYWHGYLLANGTVGEIAKSVKIKRAATDYTEAAVVILDAKFGVKSIKTEMDETTWEEELEKAGIKNIILSHSDPGDIALGHKRVKEYLKPHYSVVKDKSFPGMMFAEEGCRGDRGPIQDIFNYQWKPGTDKPEEDYKDFADTVRYGALEQPVYRPPLPEIDPRIVRMLMDEKMKGDEQRYNPLSFGLRMAG